MADHALSEANGLPPVGACGKGGSLLSVGGCLDTGDMVFIEHDALLPLQRLPEMTSKCPHYHDDEMQSFGLLLRNMTLCQDRGTSLAYALKSAD